LGEFIEKLQKRVFKLYTSGNIFEPMPRRKDPNTGKGEKQPLATGGIRATLDRKALNSNATAAINRVPAKKQGDEFLLKKLLLQTLGKA